MYVVSDYILQSLAHYFRGDQSLLLELPEPGTRTKIINDSTYFEAAMRVVAEYSRGKRSWLVYSRPFHGDPRGLVLEEFKKRGDELNQSFAGIELYQVPAQPQLLEV